MGNSRARDSGGLGASHVSTPSEVIDSKMRRVIVAKNNRRHRLKCQRLRSPVEYSPIQPSRHWQPDGRRRSLCRQSMEIAPETDDVNTRRYSRKSFRGDCLNRAVLQLTRLIQLGDRAVKSPGNIQRFFWGSTENGIWIAITFAGARLEIA